MILTVHRYETTTKHTAGLIFIDGVFECYTLEDTFHLEKIKHHTRIPAGCYDVELREVGGFHNRYSKKFKFHKGMLHIKNVPNYEYILIHIGNDDKDTSGCLLVGTTVNAHVNYISGSTKAYSRMYPKIAEALCRGEKVEIRFIDL